MRYGLVPILLLGALAGCTGDVPAGEELASRSLPCGAEAFHLVHDAAAQRVAVLAADDSWTVVAWGNVSGEVVLRHDGRAGSVTTPGREPPSALAGVCGALAASGLLHGTATASVLSASSLAPVDAVSARAAVARLAAGGLAGCGAQAADLRVAVSGPAVPACHFGEYWLDAVARRLAGSGIVADVTGRPLEQPRLPDGALAQAGACAPAALVVAKRDQAWLRSGYTASAMPSWGEHHIIDAWTAERAWRIDAYVARGPREVHGLWGPVASPAPPDGAVGAAPDVLHNTTLAEACSVLAALGLHAPLVNATLSRAAAWPADPGSVAALAEAVAAVDGAPPRCQAVTDGPGWAPRWSAWAADGTTVDRVERLPWCEPVEGWDAVASAQAHARPWANAELAAVPRWDAVSGLAA